MQLAFLIATFISLTLIACSPPPKTPNVRTPAALQPQTSDVPTAPALEPPATEDPAEKKSLAELDALYRRAHEHRKRQEYEAAIASLQAALQVSPLPAKLSGIRAALHYDIACSQALLGRTTEALRSLELAAEHGYADFEQAEHDDDLVSLRQQAALAPILDAFQENARRLRVYDITVFDSPDLGFAHLHSFEDIGSAYFDTLRTKYLLDAVVSQGKTEFERQLALMTWVHNRWPHTGIAEPSHEDALTILREVEAGRRFRCVEYSVVLTQVLQAMGYPARVLYLRMDGSSYGLGRGHVVTEVWSNDFQKWIVFDGQNNGTWRVDDEPLSAHEIRLARRSFSDRLRFVIGPSTWMTAESEPKRRAVWEPYFEHLIYRYDNIQPTQGDRSFRQVALIEPKERYELLFGGVATKSHEQTPSVEKVYPKLGRVHVDLAAKSSDPQRLLLTLSHSMPWFSHYRIDHNGKEMMTKDSIVEWTLVPGSNVLSITAVNVRNGEGKPARITVGYAPPRR